MSCCRSWACLPVSTAAEQGASKTVIDRLRTKAIAAPGVHTATGFQRGWVLEGYGLNTRHAFAQQGSKAGILMQVVGDGDGGEALNFKKLQQLDIRPGDFVIVNAHSEWNSELQRLEMWLNEDAPVPLVEVARLLHAKGVLKVLFLGCEVNTAVTGLRNRFTHDPMIWRPSNGATTLSGLDYTIIGRKAWTAPDLNARAAVLWLEDCAAHRIHAHEKAGAMFKRSVQPMRTLGWDAATATWTVTTRYRLTPRQLKHLPPTEARAIQGELLQLHACDGRLKEATELLTRHGVHPDVRTASGFTPLMMACSFGRSPVAMLLLKHKADIHLVDVTGRSALWYACESGLAEPVKAMLAAGADPHVKDKLGLSAWDAAKEEGHCTVLKLLPPPPVPRP